MAFWEGAAELIKALAPIATVSVAAWAATTWRKSLMNQRADDCISAAHEMEAAIDRCLSLFWEQRGLIPTYDRSQELARRYDEVWKVSWRRFDQAYAVARRYHPTLPREVPRKIEAIMGELGKYVELHSHGSMVSERPPPASIAPRVDALLKLIEDTLQPQEAWLFRFMRSQPLLAIRLYIHQWFKKKLIDAKNRNLNQKPD